MKNEELIHIANLWIDAFNTKQLEKLLSLYDDQAEHIVLNSKQGCPKQMD